MVKLVTTHKRIDKMFLKCVNKGYISGIKYSIYHGELHTTETIRYIIHCTFSDIRMRQHNDNI